MTNASGSSTEPSGRRLNKKQAGKWVRANRGGRRKPSHCCGAPPARGSSSSLEAAVPGLLARVREGVLFLSRALRRLPPKIPASLKVTKPNSREEPRKRVARDFAEELRDQTQASPPHGEPLIAASGCPLIDLQAEYRGSSAWFRVWS